MTEEKAVRPIITNLKGRFRFECDRCHASIGIVGEETESPVWATYSCDCGKWVQYGAWGGRTNVWEYEPTNPNGRA